MGSHFSVGDLVKVRFQHRLGEKTYSVKRCDFFPGWKKGTVPTDCLTLSHTDALRKFNGLTYDKQKKVIAAKTVFTPEERKRIEAKANERRRSPSMLPEWSERLFKELRPEEQYEICQADKIMMGQDPESGNGFWRWRILFKDWLCHPDTNAVYLTRMGL